MTAPARPWMGTPVKASLTALALGVALVMTTAPQADAALPSGPDSHAHDRLVSRAVIEAAQRFGLPETWIRAVIQAESAFDPSATSHAGAMGLMQVMPATWAELRVRYRLGPDPYSPRDNILAGAAYLRELYNRFGPEGFLAAYNAGPGRYLEHLRTGRPLPLETRLYVARIGDRLGLKAADAMGQAAPPGSRPSTLDPLSAPLFVAVGGAGAAPASATGPAASSLFAAGGRGLTDHE